MITEKSGHKKAENTAAEVWLGQHRTKNHHATKNV
jgi:hypothetical protein